MALNIKSAETDRLARELAALTGESITEAVTKALDERIARERKERNGLRREELRAKLREVREAFSKAPVLDPRPVDEILGYNESGTFD